MTDQKTETPEQHEFFKRCHVCSAVLPNRPDDVRDHLAWHKHQDTQMNALRREHTELRQQAAGAKDTANQARKDAAALLGQIHAARDAAAPADALGIAELTDDEIEQYTPDDGPASTYLDDQQHDAEDDDAAVTRSYDPEDAYFITGPGSVA